MGDLARIGVDPAIQLDHQLELVTVEIRDEDPDRVLATKLQTQAPAASKTLPEGRLGRG